MNNYVVSDYFSKEVHNFYLNEFISFLRLEATKIRLFNDEAFEDFRLWEPADIIDAYSSLYKFARHCRYSIYNAVYILPYIITTPFLELWNKDKAKQQVVIELKRKEFVRSRYPTEIPDVPYPNITLSDFASYISEKTQYLIDELIQEPIDTYCLDDIEVTYNDLCEFAQKERYSIPDVMTLYPDLVKREYLSLPTKRRTKLMRY